MTAFVMKTIARKQCLAATSGLEELTNLVDDNTPLNGPLAKVFLRISDIIEEYKRMHCPMEDPKQYPIKRKQKCSPIFHPEGPYTSVYGEKKILYR